MHLRLAINEKRLHHDRNHYRHDHIIVGKNGHASLKGLKLI